MERADKKTFSCSQVRSMTLFFSSSMEISILAVLQVVHEDDVTHSQEFLESRSSFSNANVTVPMF